FRHFARLQVHNHLMVRRQLGAAHFLPLCVRSSSRESSGGVGLFFQLLGVFTLSGALTEIGGEFLHRFFASLFLRLVISVLFLHRFFTSFLLLLGRRLRRAGFRMMCPELPPRGFSLGWRMRHAGFRRRPRTGLGDWDRRCDLLCARNVNPRQGSLLVGGFVLLVIVFDIAVGNLIGIFLQRAAELL